MAFLGNMMEDIMIDIEKEKTLARERLVKKLEPLGVSLDDLLGVLQ